MTEIGRGGLPRPLYFPILCLTTRSNDCRVHAYYAYQKKDERLPARVRAEVLKRFEQITGKKP